MNRQLRGTHRARDVFINVPFDDDYEQLFLALIAGLTGLRFTPRSVLEIPRNERRIERILEVLEECSFSVHDLLRVELSSGVPRFNMPFELGLACGFAHRRKTHGWIVLESKRYRLLKSLSDLGTDHHVHGGRPSGLIRELTNAFTGTGTQQQPSVQDLLAVYRHLQVAAETIKKANRMADLYQPRGFRDLVLSAQLKVNSLILAGKL